MIEIEVCERLMDHWIDQSGERRPKYHAQIKWYPEIWGCGRSPGDAIGSLVQSHSERFGVTVTHLEGRQAR